MVGGEEEGKQIGIFPCALHNFLCFSYFILLFYASEADSGEESRCRCKRLSRAKKNIKNKNMPRRPAVKGRRNKFASFRHEL